MKIFYYALTNAYHCYFNEMTVIAGTRGEAMDAMFSLIGKE